MARDIDQLCFLSIKEAASLIQRRELSPVELVEAFLERIQEVDSDIKSYVTLLDVPAMGQARVAEGEILRGHYKGPLHGIPLAHKDLYDTQGVRTTGQSKVHEYRVPRENATTIQRLNDAGSILLGKLAMFEFAMGGPDTSLFEQARNPWNILYQTSGSSSGSGAAVAGGLCMGSLGSDTGGSIRGPASYCGIVGLKPTYGRVTRHGVMPLSWSLDHCGPMARTVEDSALLLQAIAGHDTKDPSSARHPVPDYTLALREDVEGLVIGIPYDYCHNVVEDIDKENVMIVETAIRELGRLGAIIQNVSLPSLEYAPLANNVIAMSEAYSYHLPNLRAQPENYGETFLRRLFVGGLSTAADYVQAQRFRTRITQEFRQIMETVDLIAMPTQVNPPGVLEDMRSTAPILGPSFMAPFNQTGMPAMSIPCGFDSNGLPVGLQLAGRPFDEPTVLRAAYTYQQHVGLYKLRPPL